MIKKEFCEICGHDQKHEDICPKCFIPTENIKTGNLFMKLIEELSGISQMPPRIKDYKNDLVHC